MADGTTPEDDKPKRKLHPIYDVIVRTESTWARDRTQQWERTRVIVRDLVDAGMVTGGELIDGMFYCNNSN